MRDRAPDMRDVFAIPAVALGGTVALMVLPPLGMPLNALLMGRLVYGGFDALAMTAAVLGTIVSLLVSPADVVFVGLTFAGLIVAARMLRSGPAWKATSVLTLVSSVGLAAALVATFGPVGVFDAARTEFQASLDRTSSAVEEYGGGPEAAESFEEGRDELLELLVQIWPAVAFVTVLVGSAVAVRAFARTAQGRDERVAPPTPLSQVDLSIHIVWPLIAGLASLAAASGVGVPDGPFGVLGRSAIVVALPLLMAQGLAVAESSLARFGLGRIARLVAYAIMTPFGTIVPVLSTLGVIDLWVNFRKLPRGAQGEGGPGASRDAVE